MNTVNIQLTLPVDLYNDYIQQSLNISFNDYIIKLISKSLNNKTNSFNNSLIEGYKASEIEDAEIISDFSGSDLENWD